MSDFSLDTKGLESFHKELDDLQKLFPKEARRLMQRTGTKARTIVVRRARQTVNKVSGRYLKSIKRGKVWVDDSTGEYKVRVYTRAPHGHLIEKGHRIVGKDGSEHGFVQGYHVFDKAAKDIEKQFSDIVEAEFDKIMRNL
ncbi:HK97 gp10 family phage protein [Paenibacillus sp. 32O-W]|uniref:HK97 gp10 family phage protein n=1 Tax=Paenibacillus sp. 32O-W TaxID=1695218 RepID=UPI0011A7607C|nr:HK97 gp10 family phage protein [Paenibacillus sp. 32O-W]